MHPNCWMTIIKVLKWIQKYSFPMIFLFAFFQNSTFQCRPQARQPSSRSSSLMKAAYLPTALSFCAPARLSTVCHNVTQKQMFIIFFTNFFVFFVSLFLAFLLDDFLNDANKINLSCLDECRYDALHQIKHTRLFNAYEYFQSLSDTEQSSYMSSIRETASPKSFSFPACLPPTAFLGWFSYPHSFYLVS